MPGGGGGEWLAADLEARWSTERLWDLRCLEDSDGVGRFGGKGKFSLGKSGMIGRLEGRGVGGLLWSGGGIISLGWGKWNFRLREAWPLLSDSK